MTVRRFGPASLYYADGGGRRDTLDYDQSLMKGMRTTRRL